MLLNNPDHQPGPDSHTLHEWRSLAVGNFVDRGSFAKVSVNEAIAATDRFANWAEGTIEADDDFVRAIVTRHRNLSSVLCWFRERSGSQTLGDVLSAIENRTVPDDIIRLWAEMIPDTLPAGKIAVAIAETYPDLRPVIAAQIQRSTGARLENSRRIVEEL